jgi:hypothetical protein
MLKSNFTPTFILMEINEHPIITKSWNDRFPPLNLWNYPAKWISEVFYKNQGS